MDKNKLKLTFLLLIAAIPITLATWSYSVRETAGVKATSNKGVLVVPVLDVTEFDLRNADGTPAYQAFDEMVAGVDPADYDPRPWQLLYLSAGDCADPCLERLYFLRQLHARLAHDSSRVERVYVHVDNNHAAMPESTLATLTRQQPGLRVIHADAAALRQRLARTVPTGADPVTNHYIYVVDPVGNVMLYFTPDNTPEQILSDLEKLLDQSSLG
jgi:hypothetical protein